LISRRYFQGMICQVFHLTRYAVFFQFDFICTFMHFRSKSKVHFDAIKISLNCAAGGTVCTKPLRMCSFHQQR